jgi:hypothetical protein
MGMAQDGFETSPSFSSTNGGLTAAFLLSQGFPAYAPAPDLSAGFLNGQSGPTYRQLGGNSLPYREHQEPGGQFLMCFGISHD